jgi:hypothetical protein
LTVYTKGTRRFPATVRLVKIDVEGHELPDELKAMTSAPRSASHDGGRQ